MDRERDSSDVARKVEAYLKVFREGEAVTQEILKENERLRDRIVQLEEEMHALKRRGSEDGDAGRLRRQLLELEEEKMAILNRFREVEEENKDFVAKYVEVEEENNNLANLYVASYQLHSTLDFKEVIRIVLEIIINLIGADRFALMLLNEGSDELAAVAAEGIDVGEVRRVRVGEGIMGTVAHTGESHFESNLEQAPKNDDQYPLVCIPLKIQDHVIGVIAIFSLMEQKKKQLTRVDYELFSMLAGHAATAIFSSKLYAQSERRLSTIQGFIDLLSGKLR